MTISIPTFPAGGMDLRLAENDRRLAAYDTRLLRPGFVLVMVRLTRRVMGVAKAR